MQWRMFKWFRLFLMLVLNRLFSFESFTFIFVMRAMLRHFFLSLCSNRLCGSLLLLSLLFLVFSNRIFRSHFWFFLLSRLFGLFSRLLFRIRLLINWLFLLYLGLGLFLLNRCSCGSGSILLLFLSYWLLCLLLFLLLLVFFRL